MTQVQARCFDDSKHGFRIIGVRLAQEAVWFPGDHADRRQRPDREVSHIERQDGARTRFDCRSEDMAIIRVREGEGSDMMLIVPHIGF